LDKPVNNQLSYLDFTVNNEKEVPVFKFYRKKARRDVFMNFYSAIANTQKVQIIQNEIMRIKYRSSRSIDFIEETQKFRKILEKNEYTENVLKSNFDSFNKKQAYNSNNREIKKRLKSENKNRIFLKIPFINERVYSSIKSIFIKINKKHKINFRPYSQPKSLKSML
jgi:hypothetical protein